MAVFSRVWRSENDFRRMLVDASLFYSVLPSSCAEDGYRQGKIYICCVTSVDFICSVPLSRIMDTSEVRR